MWERKLIIIFININKLKPFKKGFIVIEID